MAAGRSLGPVILTKKKKVASYQQTLHYVSAILLLFTTAEV